MGAFNNLLSKAQGATGGQVAPLDSAVNEEKLQAIMQDEFDKGYIPTNNDNTVLAILHGDDFPGGYIRDGLLWPLSGHLENGKLGTMTIAEFYGNLMRGGVEYPPFKDINAAHPATVLYEYSYGWEQNTDLEKKLSTCKDIRMVNAMGGPGYTVLQLSGDCSGLSDFLGLLKGAWNPKVLGYATYVHGELIAYCDAR